ncbi:uncharacterized protein TRAVEDRAFT_42428 [Trametes versicolor FP-101664 SS1]|uniref:uncharacterized protein n=1 Tax=Trametes versicolor (strain FP-101664) TaxID=717944 RepID=UPI0004622861|nr:uncharacterized protein TRAVEDRAFT_42428 [Trametes versicolor FP-101664 SS1]EIW65031.1 hypothetical protein TRAVEDRAFT_42428 [Trametes versicolor FP-101664 SS1]
MTRRRRAKSGFHALGDTARGQYARKEMQMRGEVRKGLKDILVTRVGDVDPKVSMHWTVSGLYRNIYLRHRLKLVGWPKGIAFGDLSKTVTGLDRISILVQALRSGDLTFEPISQAEYDAAKQNPLLAAPTHLNGGLRPHPSRNDTGRRRGSSKVDPAIYPPRHVRDGPKSSKVVSDEAEARAEGPEEPHELFKGGQLYAGPRPGRLCILN